MSEPAPCPFGLCDGSGFILDEEANTTSDCRCRPGRISAARSRSLEGRIPRAYRDVAFERFPVTEMPTEIVREVRRFVRDIDQNLAEGRGLWFVGDTGTGKTSLAMLVSRSAIEVGHSVAVYSLPRLLLVLRNSIDSPDGNIGLLDRLSEVGLLHIDDVGNAWRHQRDKQRAEAHDGRPSEPEGGYSEWTLDQLYSVINSRYEDKRSLMLTTNLFPDDLEAQIGAHLVSRIMEMCGDPLPMFGDDKRRELRSA